jgi:hypothetical protein
LTLALAYQPGQREELVLGRTRAEASAAGKLSIDDMVDEWFTRVIGLDGCERRTSWGTEKASKLADAP